LSQTDCKKEEKPAPMDAGQTFEKTVL